MDPFIIILVLDIIIGARFLPGEKGTGRLIWRELGRPSEEDSAGPNRFENWDRMGSPSSALSLFQTIS